MVANGLKKAAEGCAITRWRLPGIIFRLMMYMTNDLMFGEPGNFSPNQEHVSSSLQKTYFWFSFFFLSVKPVMSVLATRSILSCTDWFVAVCQNVSILKCFRWSVGAPLFPYGAC